MALIVVLYIRIKKEKTINITFGMVQQGVSSAAEWIVGNMNDENKSRQTLDVTYNQIPGADAVANYTPRESIGKNGLQQVLNANHEEIADSSASTKHDYLLKISDMKKEIEKQRYRIRERIRESVMTEEQPTRQKEQWQIQYRRRKENMSSNQLATEKQNCHRQDLREQHNHRKENINLSKAANSDNVFTKNL